MNSLNQPTSQHSDPFNQAFPPRRKNEGFTFIEMLVVVTVIGILAAVGVVSYQAANKNARDGKRRADLEQVRAALEMYKADSTTNVYPGSLSAVAPPTSTYINPLPSPPANSKKTDDTTMTSYEDGYSCSNPFRIYSLCLKLESGSDYCVYNP